MHYILQTPNIIFILDHVIYVRILHQVFLFFNILYRLYLTHIQLNNTDGNLSMEPDGEISASNGWSHGEVGNARENRSQIEQQPKKEINPAVGGQQRTVFD